MCFSHNFWGITPQQSQHKKSGETVTPTYTHTFPEARAETLRTCTWLCYHTSSDGASNLLDELRDEDKDLHLWLNCSALAQQGQVAGRLHSSLSSATDCTPHSEATKHQQPNLKMRCLLERHGSETPSVFNSPWLPSLSFQDPWDQKCTTRHPKMEAVPH